MKLAGFKPLKPMVFAGLYPVESHAYGELREATCRGLIGRVLEIGFGSGEHLAGHRPP